MNKYLIEKNELISIAFFNGMSEHQWNDISTKKIADWNKAIFNDLLVKQPELKPFYDEFISQLPQHATVAFGELFQGKIELQSMTHCVFKRVYGVRCRPSERADLIKRLHSKTAQLLPMLDDAIKNNNLLDDGVWDGYFQILKDKATDKSQYSNEHILANIKNFHAYDLVTAKKKIITYMSLFPKDQSLYDIIMTDMDVLIKNDASVRNY